MEIATFIDDNTLYDDNFDAWLVHTAAGSTHDQMIIHDGASLRRHPTLRRIATSVCRATCRVAAIYDAGDRHGVAVRDEIVLGNHGGARQRDSQARVQ